MCVVVIRYLTPLRNTIRVPVGQVIGSLTDLKMLRLELIRVMA